MATNVIDDLVDAYIGIVWAWCQQRACGLGSRCQGTGVEEPPLLPLSGPQINMTPHDPNPTTLIRDREKRETEKV